MATSHDKMRLEAATKAYKAGEYKKALAHLQKMHDQSKVKGRIQQVQRKIKEQEAPPPEDDFMAAIGGNPADDKPKAKPVKKQNWLRRIAIGVLATVLLFGGVIVALRAHFASTFDEGAFHLDTYCYGIMRDFDYCDQWVENVLANEAARVPVDVCTGIYDAYREEYRLQSCFGADGINPLEPSGFTPVIEDRLVTDNMYAALARGKVYCENWRSEEYCGAWTWYQLNRNFDTMMQCYFQYPAVEQLIGFQECITTFAALDV